MKFLKTALIVILFIVAITFAIKNQDPVSLRYYFFEGAWTMPLFLLIFFCVLIGILIAGAVGVFAGFKLKYEIKRNKKTILELENELNSLRTLPITASKGQDEEDKGQ